jgi:hypothetical protein
MDIIPPDIIERTPNSGIQNNAAPGASSAHRAGVLCPVIVLARWVNSALLQIGL